MILVVSKLACGMILCVHGNLSVLNSSINFASRTMMRLTGQPVLRQIKRGEGRRGEAGRAGSCEFGQSDIPSSASLTAIIIVSFAHYTLIAKQSLTATVSLVSRILPRASMG
jgi:hypothetical protein